MSVEDARNALLFRSFAERNLHPAARQSEDSSKPGICYFQAE
jgi:hypothetical protein